MPVHPIYTLHILYDSDIVDEKLLNENLCTLAEQISDSSTTNTNVRLSLISMSYRLEAPLEPKTFIEELAKDKYYRIDLKRAFEQVVSDYHFLERDLLGTGNPEILILMGTQPVSDWLSGWREIEGYRVLILTYWMTKQLPEGNAKIKIEELLGQISLFDPETKTPRFKIIQIDDNNMSSLLKDIFSKLKGRLEGRTQQLVKLSIQGTKQNH